MCVGWLRWEAVTLAWGCGPGLQIVMTNTRFHSQSARASGIRVEQRRCLDAELVAHVAGPGPPTLAIALVDRDCLAHGSLGTHFWGHYVVVCDFDGELVALQDPAREGLQWLSAQVFHAARKARGTDWDVLLVTGPVP